jgi:DNA-binding CsgD family transcriptional regulator
MQISEKQLSDMNIGAGLTSDIETIRNYYNTVALKLPGNVYSLDRNACGLFCSQSSMDLLGFDNSNEYIGMSYEDYRDRGMLTEEGMRKVKNDALCMMESKEVQFNVKEPAIKNVYGRTLYLISSRTPIYNQAGEVIGLIGSSVDLETLKKSPLNEGGLSSLTRVQGKVLSLYNQGLLRKEIAAKCFIAESTVAWYLREIRAKFNIRTRKEMLELERGL